MDRLYWIHQRILSLNLDIYDHLMSLLNRVWTLEKNEAFNMKDLGDLYDIKVKLYDKLGLQIDDEF